MGLATRLAHAQSPQSERLPLQFSHHPTLRSTPSHQVQYSTVGSQAPIVLSLPRWLADSDDTSIARLSLINIELHCMAIASLSARKPHGDRFRGAHLEYWRQDTNPFHGCLNFLPNLTGPDERENSDD